jgi:DNA-binding MarR family transcriptional regulator
VAIDHREEYHVTGKDKVAAVQQQRRNLSRGKFDSNGVRKAVIALLKALHDSGRHGTIAEVLVALEVIDATLEGRPHSMRSLSEALNIPYTSVSRIVFSLTSEAAPGGILKLVPDTKDRRRKHIEVDQATFRQTGSHIRALEDAMLDYYGTSVQKLRARKA